MARGDSGRIVIEVDPHLKGELYVELARRGLTLKAWFVSEAERLVESGRQPALFAAEPDPPLFAPRGGERSTRGKS